jgi:hypothetical protein
MKRFAQDLFASSLFAGLSCTLDNIIESVRKISKTLDADRQKQVCYWNMEREKQPVTRLDYCQYLLSSQINYTLTNFADHTEKFSHDTINRYLAGEIITPRLVWENVKGQVEQIGDGYVMFDDTIVDKNFSFKMELVRRQYSGDAHGVIKGIGVVTCVYVNPKLDRFWIIDYRIYDPQGDGKTKLEHVQDMLTHCVYQKKLLFRFVLMDSWYATKDMMLSIEGFKKIYYCPLKDNRQVDDSGGEKPYQRVDGLHWSETEKQQGKTIKIKGFPKEHKVKLFRVVLTTERTDYIVTNDWAQADTQVVQKVCGLRWKIEQPNNLPGWKVANVVKPESSAITSAVPFWYGSNSSKWLRKRNIRFIRSSMAY